MCAILHNAKVILFIAKGLLLHCIQASVALQLRKRIRDASIYTSKKYRSSFYS